MGINISPTSLVGYKQSVNFLGDSKTATAPVAPAMTDKPEGDTVTIFGKQVDKKKAIAGGIIGAAALAGIVAAVVYAVRGGAIGAATRNAKKMTNEANQLAETVKHDIDQVREIFEKASHGGMDGVTIKEGKNGVKIMKEMTDGNVTRKTVIESGLPSKITTYLKGGKKDIITIDQGKQKSLYKAAYKLNEKTKAAKWDKELESTLTGVPTIFAKKVSLKDGVYTAGKRLTLEGGKAATYGEKFKRTADNVITYVKGLTFKNGKPAVFVKSYEKLADGTITEHGKKTYDGKKWTSAKAA